MDEAVRDLVATGIAEHEEAEGYDLDWAKPLVDEVLAERERGEFTVIHDIDAFLRDIFRPEHGWWPGSTSVHLRRRISPGS